MFAAGHSLFIFLTLKYGFVLRYIREVETRRLVGDKIGQRPLPYGSIYIFAVYFFFFKEKSEEGEKRKSISRTKIKCF